MARTSQKGTKNGGERKDAADHGVEIAFGQRGDDGERVNGSADGAPGDGSGVGDEIERGGVEGFEAEADHEGAGDGHGSTEAGRTFDECAEAKSDEEKLQAAVGSDGGDGLLHDFELAGFDGDVVEEDGGDDDPDNFHEAERGAVEEAGDGEFGGHAEDEDGAEDGGGGAGDGAPVGADFKPGEESEEDNDGEGGDQGGEPPVAEGIVDLCPGHDKCGKNYLMNCFDGGEQESEEVPSRAEAPGSAAAGSSDP